MDRMKLLMQPWMGASLGLNLLRKICMNERIKELWEQCKTIEWSTDNPVYDREMFAELLIKECVNLIKPTRPYPWRGNDWEQGFHVGQEDAADHLEECFGIK